MPNSSEVFDLIPPERDQPADGGIDLLAVLVTLLTEWKVGLAAFLVVLVGGVAYVASIKPQYAASASILPQSSRSSSVGLSSLFGVRGVGSLYVGLLKSRTVLDSTIDRAHLLSLYHTTSYETARGILASRTTLTEGADTTVRISVRDANAANAAVIANCYIDALSELNENMSLEDSKRTRTFFEKQLDQEKGELSTAENTLEKTEKQTGMVQPETQTQIGLNAIAQTRAQITNLEVQLSSLRQSATEQNPEVQRLATQVAQLRMQEAQLEAGSRTPLGAAPSASQLPGNNLDVARAQRQVHYHDSLLESLTSEYEKAYLDESFSHQEFQVIDRAVAPEHKDWPPRRPFLYAVFGGSLLAGLVVMIGKIVCRRVLNDPSHQQSLKDLRALFGR